MTRVMAGRSWVGQPLVDDLLDVVRGLAQAPAASSRQQPFGLTNREREVLALVVAGCANKEIAQRFAVSEETIKHHLTRMFDKVGAANRLELAMTATRVGLVNSTWGSAPHRHFNAQSPRVGDPPPARSLAGPSDPAPLSRRRAVARLAAPQAAASFGLSSVSSVSSVVESPTSRLKPALTSSIPHESSRCYERWSP